MLEYLPKAKIFVCEQMDDKPFNRGKLLNILYLETKPEFFVCHDVDMIPVKVNYLPCGTIAQLASSEIQTVDYLGGVTMFCYMAFELSGGYHNDFFSRAEDNEFMFNLKRLKIPVEQRRGTFEQLPHERNGPEFIPYLWMKAQKKRSEQNQLHICKYELISKQEIDGYTLLKVSL